MKKKETIVMDIVLNQRIVRNIKTLLSSNNLNPYTFQQKLTKSEQYTISYPYLNKILNHPEEKSMPLVYLIQCCQFFNISLDKMVSSELTFNDCIAQPGSDFKKIIDSSQIFNESTPELDEETKASSEDNFIHAQSNPSLFIEDSGNPLFSSFLQTYYCYFYPTVSSENKSVNSMLSGTLTLKSEKKKCKVILVINTKKEKDNKPTYKTYEGTAVISSSAHNIYCTLKSEEIGEFCYIIFRHFHLNYALQDCHMAAVLSTSSAGRNRYPTFLRMFLSRDEISPKDLNLLAPHLWLNYSQIAISQKGLLTLKESCAEYAELVDDLFDTASPEPMYLLREKDILGYAKKYLIKSEKVTQFLTELRLQSLAYRYNKVSDTVETSVRNLLLSLGYYKNNAYK